MSITATQTQKAPPRSLFFCTGGSSYRCKVSQKARTSRPEHHLTGTIHGIELHTIKTEPPYPDGMASTRSAPRKFSTMQDEPVREKAPTFFQETTKGMMNTKKKGSTQEPFSSLDIPILRYSWSQETSYHHSNQENHTIKG